MMSPTLARYPEVPSPQPERVADVRIEPPMVYVPPAWEYRVVHRSLAGEATLDEGELDAMGAEGWELVGIATDERTRHFYFKRMTR